MGKISIGPHVGILKALKFRKGQTPTLRLEISVRRGEPEKSMLQFLREHLSRRVTIELRPRPPGKRERVRLRLREFVPAYGVRVVRIETAWGI